VGVGGGALKTTVGAFFEAQSFAFSRFLFTGDCVVGLRANLIFLEGDEVSAYRVSEVSSSGSSLKVADDDVDDSASLSIYNKFQG
jgi:hypothetical protein